MSLPPQPTQPQFQPPPPPQVGPLAQPSSQPTKKLGRFGWAPLAGLVRLAVGAIMGTAANGTDGTASPAATVTVTATAQASDPTTEPTKSASKAPVTKKTSKPKPPAVKPAVNVSKRQWAKIVKSPKRHLGERYIIYGQVSQFDSATGDDTFLADTAYRNTMSYGRL